MHGYENIYFIIFSGLLIGLKRQTMEAQIKFDNRNEINSRSYFYIQAVTNAGKNFGGIF